MLCCCSKNFGYAVTTLLMPAAGGVDRFGSEIIRILCGNREEMVRSKGSYCESLRTLEDGENMPIISKDVHSVLRSRGLRLRIGLCLILIIINMFIFWLPPSARDALDLQFGSELQLSSWPGMGLRESQDVDILRRYLINRI